MIKINGILRQGMDMHEERLSSALGSSMGVRLFLQLSWPEWCAHRLQLVAADRRDVPFAGRSRCLNVRATRRARMTLDGHVLPHAVGINGFRFAVFRSAARDPEQPIAFSESGHPVSTLAVICA